MLLCFMKKFQMEMETLVATLYDFWSKEVSQEEKAVSALHLELRCICGEGHKTGDTHPATEKFQDWNFGSNTGAWESLFEVSFLSNQCSKTSTFSWVPVSTRYVVRSRKQGHWVSSTAWKPKRGAPRIEPGLQERVTHGVGQLEGSTGLGGKLRTTPSSVTRQHQCSPRYSAPIRNWGCYGKCGIFFSKPNKHMSLHVYIHVGMEKQLLKKRLIEVVAVATLNLIQ